MIFDKEMKPEQPRRKPIKIYKISKFTLIELARPIVGARPVLQNDPSPPASTLPFQKGIKIA